VVKLTLAYDPDDSTHEGLYNTLQFKNYVDPETDEDLGDKPHIQHAIDSMRNIFAKPGEIVFYLRNEETDFELEFAAMIKEMGGEDENGRIINKFYPPGSTIKKDGTHRVPFLQIGVQVPITDRPPISTLKTFIHRDFTDFATRKGYAAIQSMEYERQEVQKFNDTPASVKFLTIPGGGNQKYLVVIYIDPEVEKRMQVGDWKIAVDEGRAMEYGRRACTKHHQAVFSLYSSPLHRWMQFFLFGGGCGAGIWARDTQSKIIT
jgi:hypothetical protein